MKAILGDRGRVVVYPCYLDSNKSESQGRKIPRSLAVPSPKIDEIFRAARDLNLEPAIEEKAHPAWWWEEVSRVSVKKVGPKRKILVMIAKKIAEERKKSRR